MIEVCCEMMPLPYRRTDVADYPNILTKVGDSHTNVLCHHPLESRRQAIDTRHTSDGADG